MLIISSFFACAPSDYFTPISDVDAERIEVGDGSDLSSDRSLSGTRSAVDSTPVVLDIQLPRDMDGFIELRPYRLNEDGSVGWVGAALSSDAIEGARMSVVLPHTPPARDRLDLEKSVSYALTLRGMSAAETPSIYKGISEARIVFVGEETSEIGSPGWNVVVGFDGPHATSTWLSPEDTVFLSENIVTPRTFVLSGTAATSVTSDTRLVIATSGDAEAIVLADKAIDPAWSVGVGGSGSSILAEVMGASEEGGGLTPVGMGFRAFTYEDIDGDGMRTSEPISGEVCLDGEPTMVTWFEPATTLDAALRLAAIGRRAGWDLIGVREDGSFPAAREDRAALTLEVACD